MSTPRKALITGAAMGLGKALANQLLANGWQVITIDREPADARGIQSQSTHLQCDLADPAAVNSLIDLVGSHAPFDLVILNAAASASGKFENMPTSSYTRLLQLNAVTPMVMASQLAGRNIFGSKSHLVFISSLSHFTGYPGAAVYSATKDAIAVYAASIRKPFAKLGISVSCVFPGPMKTAQADRHAPKGANADKRMAAELAAGLILKGVFADRATIIPGFAPRAFALFGKYLPSVSDRIMRRIIYAKLDRDTY